MRQRENLVVVAREAGELVGFAMAQFGNDFVHMTLLGVALEHQRRGIGRKLMAWVEESAVTAGLFDMKLEVRASNVEGRRFYAALGYRERLRINGYYSGVEDAIRMMRDLRTPTPRGEKS
jgi:ribosomal-protein-alanine N-acetyltransferase